nr:HNH endonuclease signature motif containing protein [Actinokineospora baliensis]
MWPSTEVDHVIAGDDHALSNLQGVCGPCHRAKSSSEGGRAAAAARHPARVRPREPHPGELPRPTDRPDRQP